MSFEKALLDAIPFLRNLPRARNLQESVWTQLATFRAAHSDVGVDLVVDQPPGSPEIDFDLLLQGDDEGTVAIGWRPDARIPWNVQYSEHWASSLVLSVNAIDVTIQDAFQVLRISGDAESDLSTRLVDHCLIAAAIIKDPPVVSDSEIQSAADAFRLAQGLHSAETTERWLTEAGLSIERFEALIKTTVQARKLKERITAEQVGAYFSSHADSLAMVTVIRAHSASEDSLSNLTISLATIDELVNRAGIRIVIETGFAPTALPSLPPESAAPPAGTVIGPVQHRGEYWCGQVIRRLTPRLNPETERFIQDQIFASWLDEERAKAHITWHWM